jgi:hypothetical protein
MPRYMLSVGEPLDFEGPDGENRIIVESCGVVDGPELRNWQDRYVLLKVLTPFQCNSESVSFLLAAPRHAGLTLEGILKEGGVVGVARVRQGAQLTAGSRMDPTQVEYILIGGLSPIGFEENMV